MSEVKPENDLERGLTWPVLGKKLARGSGDAGGAGGDFPVSLSLAGCIARMECVQSVAWDSWFKSEGRLALLETLDAPGEWEGVVIALCIIE